MVYHCGHSFADLQGVKFQTFEMASNGVDLLSGLNFKVIQGKQANSKLVIVGEFAYLLDHPREQSPGVLYIRCKFAKVAGCKVRGKIENQFATIFNMDTIGHSCNGEASPMRWRAQEAMNRMKERAANETSTLDVSISSSIRYYTKLLYVYFPLSCNN